MVSVDLGGVAIGIEHFLKDEVVERDDVWATGWCELFNISTGSWPQSSRWHWESYKLTESNRMPPSVFRKKARLQKLHILPKYTSLKARKNR